MADNYARRALSSVRSPLSLHCCFAMHPRRVQPLSRPIIQHRLLISLCLTVTFFATSAGISRAVMLVVPVHVRPFALGLNTLICTRSARVLAPLILGLIIGAWSPACSSTVHVPLNTSDPDACPSSSAGGGVKLNPMCSANATTVLAGGHPLGAAAQPHLGLALRGGVHADGLVLLGLADGADAADARRGGVPAAARVRWRARLSAARECSVTCGLSLDV